MADSFIYLVLYKFKPQGHQECIPGDSEDEGDDLEHEESHPQDCHTEQRKRGHGDRGHKMAKPDSADVPEEMEVLLKIPNSRLITLTTNSLAWMRYVGTAILGVNGDVIEAPDREDGKAYEFVANDSRTGE